MHVQHQDDKPHIVGKILLQAAWPTGIPGGDIAGWLVESLGCLVTKHIAAQPQSAGHDADDMSCRCHMIAESTG